MSCTHHACTPFLRPASLKEMHFKDLMGEIDPNIAAGGRSPKLPYRDWAKLIPYIEYRETRRNTMKFFVPNKMNGWETYIQFVEWNDQVADLSVNAAEAARLLFWGANLRVHCGCPSFSYYGFQYILTQLDAAIVPEDRVPHVRNPELRGVVCKHLRRSLRVLPFHLGDMARAIKQQRESGPLVLTTPGKAPQTAPGADAPAATPGRAA